MPFAEAVAGRYLRLAKEWSEWQDLNLRPLVPNKLAFVKIAGQQATRHVRGLLGSALLELFGTKRFEFGALLVGQRHAD